MIRVQAAATMPVPPAVVYALLADYRDGHPRIVPPRYFSELEVERGGVGDGTLIRFRLHAFGASRQVRAEVTEPKPGRVLAETDLETGAVTTFTVRSRDAGSSTQVTIATQWAPRGLRGFFERLFAPGLLRRVYAQELQLLAAAAAARAESPMPASSARG